jgi:hypothetical protein
MSARVLLRISGLENKEGAAQCTTRHSKVDRKIVRVEKDTGLLEK